jgi:hypothetical protein
MEIVFIPYSLTLFHLLKKKNRGKHRFFKTIRTPIFFFILRKVLSAMLNQLLLLLAGCSLAAVGTTAESATQWSLDAGSSLGYPNVAFDGARVVVSGTLLLTRPLVVGPGITVSCSENGYIVVGDGAVVQAQGSPSSPVSVKEERKFCLFRG